MRTNLSAIASPFHSLAYYPSHLSLKQRRPLSPLPRRAFPQIHVSSSRNERPQRTGDLTPPWRYRPPTAPPRAPVVDDDASLIGFLANASPIGIPPSLRMVQMKMKRVNPDRAAAPAADIGADQEIQRSDLAVVGVKVRPWVSELAGYKRRAMAYEDMIASGMTNSVILANYAQLLFQYENNLDRSNHYFKWAVEQDPTDAEAISKYAAFLWHGYCDLEAAEEMFLMAIEVEPKNCHHLSCYALFLWRTGGTETCYPLDGQDGCDQEV